MKKLILALLLLPACALAQYAPSASGSTTAAAEINSKPAIQTGSGAPGGSCTTGKDLYVDSAGSVLSFCKGTNLWAQVQAALGFTPENVANKDVNSGYAGLTAGGLLKIAECPVATGSIAGCLAAADWATFNAKQAALGYTAENIANKDVNSGYAGLTAGGLLKIAECPVATGSIAGCVAAADWATFNAKQAALGYTAENTANKDVSNGYAGLTAGGLLKVAECPLATVLAFGCVKPDGTTITISGGVISGTGTSAGVSSFTGDGILLNNAASTGGVTASLANAAARSLFGNSTGIAGTPSYLTSPHISGTFTADTGFVDGAVTVAAPLWGTAGGNIETVPACQAITASAGAATVNWATSPCATVTANGGNVTVTLSNPVSGVVYILGLCNDTTPRVWTLPGNVKQSQSPAVASTCTYTAYIYDGSNYQGPGSSEIGSIIRGSERSLPATSASGAFWCAWDSANHNMACNDNANGYNTVPVEPSTAVAHQFLTGIAATGATSQAQPAFTDISGTATSAQLPVGTAAAKGALQTDGSTISVAAGVISCTTATISQIGCVKPDGSTITIAAGVISAVGGGTGCTVGGSTNSLQYNNGSSGCSGATVVNNAILATNGSGVPADTTTIPNGVTATTQSASDNSTKLATTAYVDGTYGNAVLAASAASAAKQICTAGGATRTCSYIDYPDVKVIPAANCNAGTAGAGWSTATSNFTAACRAGSNNLGGALQAIPSTGASGQFLVELPLDWDAGIQPYINIFYGSGTNTSGTVIWTVSSACSKEDGSVSDDPAFNAESAFASQTMAVASRTWAKSGQFTAITSGNNCVAGSPLIIKVAVSGTASANINAYQAVVTIPRLLTVQAN